MTLEPGTKVWIAFGMDGDVLAEVLETYGPADRRHVLVRLTPEVTGDLVAEPVTLSLPESAIRKVQPAA